MKHLMNLDDTVKTAVFEGSETKKLVDIEKVKLDTLTNVVQKNLTDFKAKIELKLRKSQEEKSKSEEVNGIVESKNLCESKLNKTLEDYRNLESRQDRFENLTMFGLLLVLLISLVNWTSFYAKVSKKVRKLRSPGELLIDDDHAMEAMR
jgi:hypothetical protein